MLLQLSHSDSCQSNPLERLKTGKNVSMARILYYFAVYGIDLYVSNGKIILKKRKIMFEEMDEPKVIKR